MLLLIKNRVSIKKSLYQKSLNLLKIKLYLFNDNNHKTETIVNYSFLANFKSNK